MFYLRRTLHSWINRVNNGYITCNTNDNFVKILIDDSSSFFFGVLCDKCLNKLIPLGVQLKFKGIMTDDEMKDLKAHIPVPVLHMGPWRNSEISFFKTFATWLIGCRKLIIHRSNATFTIYRVYLYIISTYVLIFVHSKVCQK